MDSVSLFYHYLFIFCIYSKTTSANTARGEESGYKMYKIDRINLHNPEQHMTQVAHSKAKKYNNQTIGPAHSTKWCRIMQMAQVAQMW